MVFCNRCGKKTETVITYPKLDLWLCKECGDGFRMWLNVAVPNVKDEKPIPIPNKPDGIDMQFNLGKAQQVLQDAGYIYYKKPESWGQKQKRPRIRRTRKEIELARQNEEGRQ